MSYNGLVNTSDGKNASLLALPTYDASGNLVLPKAAGLGIKTDHSTPTFGWKDLVGEISVRGTGGTNPNFNVFRGNIREFQFGINDEVWCDFHMPHDYVPGTDLFIHAHWAVAVNTVTSGGVTWGWDITYAKGYSQAVIPATVNPTKQQDLAVGVGSNGQYVHMIAEVQLSAASPSATQLDSDDIEIDGLILTRCYLAGNTMNGAPEPFLLFTDIHYQSTQAATKNKNYPFYT
jgi:hypothetical protein